MNNSWKRLEAVIKSTGLSINKFAMTIGLNRAENLYRIKSGKNFISRELADTITTKYCNISKAWLLTGEGAMYLNDNQKEESSKIHKIPFYEAVSSVFFNSAKQIKEQLKPLYYIEVPSLINCDFAALFVGESMKPEIPSGSIVALKEVNLSLVLPGEMYLIVTEIYTTIKYIRIVEEDSTLFRLVPENKQDYDEMILDKSLIKRVFLVKGVISTKVV